MTGDIATTALAPTALRCCTCARPLATCACTPADLEAAVDPSQRGSVIDGVPARSLVRNALLVVIGVMALGVLTIPGVASANTPPTTTAHDHGDHPRCGPNASNDGCYTPTYPPAQEVCPVWLEVKPPCATGPATPLVPRADASSEAVVLGSSQVLERSPSPDDGEPELAFTGDRAAKTAAVGLGILSLGALLIACSKRRPS
jgi:hypothetical protein